MQTKKISSKGGREWRSQEKMTNRGGRAGTKHDEKEEWELAGERDMAEE